MQQRTTGARTPYTAAKEATGYWRLRATTSDSFPLYTSYSDRISFSKGDGEIVADIPGLSLARGEYCIEVGISSEKEGGDLFDETIIYVEIKAGPDFPGPDSGVFYNRVTWRTKTVE